MSSTLALMYGSAWDDDARSILVYMNWFAGAANVKEPLEVDLAALGSVLRGIRQDFPHTGGVDKASVFKKAANFVVNFIAVRPVLSPFPPGTLSDDLVKLPNHQNAVFAFELAVDALHGATILRKDNPIVLENRISVSTHSYIDIIEALTSVTPATHWKLVSVLLEQLAYRNNNDASYDCIT